MTITATTETVLSEPALTYARTVDRSLVHRDSLGEVFLTDLQPTGPTAYVAAAQLPRSHAYYGDHLLRPSTYDPVLLLEACRQSALAGAHEFFSVPTDYKFILTHLRIHLSRPERIAVGTEPCALLMRVTVVDHRRREGLTTGLDYEFDLFAKDVPIGRAAVGLRFKSPEGYTALRLKNRGGLALPSSATYPDNQGGTPVDPYRVGRVNSHNVVLTDAAVDGESARANLRIPAAHPSMFDHPQDHLPGMVIAEAARQLSLLAALEVRGMSPSKTFPTDLSVVFNQFGELDKETVLDAEVGGQTQTDDGAYYTQGGVVELPEETAADQLPVTVTASQYGDVLCVLRLSLTRVRSQS